MTESVWIDKGSKQLNINIWPKQQMFLDSDVDELFYGGAAGGGKTEAILLFILQRRMKYPGSLGIAFRRKFPDLNKSLILRSRSIFPLVGAKYNETKHEWTFPNKSIEIFGFCGSDADVYDHQSAEYADECFDELTHFTEFQFGYLTSRCRSSKAEVKPLIRSASNPGNIGHIWVKKRYVDPSQTNKIWWSESEQKRLSFIPSLLDDNPSLYLADPGYEHRLKILGEKKFRALRYGDWSVFEGQYFNEWDGKPGMHVLQQERVPDTYSMKFVSMDWGFAGPACVLWWELTPSGRVFIYRELYTTRRSPKELAEDVMLLTPKAEKLTCMWAPPEIWGKEVEKEGGGEPIQQLMESVFKDHIPMRKANNARVPGWMKVREYLSLAPDGFPWLQINPSCLNLIRTLPMMIHDEKYPEDLDTTAEDHACLVGSTLIKTDKGVQTIEQMVGSEGEVQTPVGWKKYTGVQKTRTNVEVFKLITRNGKEVIATSDHRLMTSFGWMQVKDVVLGQWLLIQSVTWTRNLFLERFKNSIINGIIFVENISKKKVFDYIEKYGNTIVERYQMGSMFITEMLIPETIKLLTWNCYRVLNTYPTMENDLQQSKQKSTWKEYVKKLSSGISQKRGESGMCYTQKKFGVKESFFRKSVWLVVNLMKQSVLKLLNFVVLIAKCVFLGKKTQYDYVKKIESVGKKDVYNFSVEDVHCYFLHNGILVKNCDAARYGAVSLKEVPRSIITPYGAKTGFDKIFGTREEVNKLVTHHPSMKGRSGYGA